MSTIENAENKREQQWQDEQAIRNILERYSDTVNRRDWATYRSFWTNDGVWDLGEPINVRKEGIEDIMTEVQRAVNSMSFFIAFCSNILLLDIFSSSVYYTYYRLSKYLHREKGTCGRRDREQRVT